MKPYALIVKAIINKNSFYFTGKKELRRITVISGVKAAFRLAITQTRVASLQQGTGRLSARLAFAR